jgi:HPt (histidine-containing phosphotransfer) domain-containing protein
MDDFLTKPVLAQTLLTTVTRWADRPLAAARMPEAPATATTPAASPTASPTASLPAYDPAVLQALPMVADGSQPGCVVEVLEIFNTSLADLLETLPRQIDQGQAAPARRALHSLKSSAASVGALALAALAAEGEALLQGPADAAALGGTAVQALPGRLCEASAQWHLALACSTAAAATARPAAAPAAALRHAEAPEALAC